VIAHIESGAEKIATARNGFSLRVQRALQRNSRVGGQTRDFVEKNYPAMGFKKIACLLGVSRTTVRDHVMSLGLSGLSHGVTAPAYSKQECDFLIANSGLLSAKELAERIGRSEKSVARKAKQMGVKFRGNKGRVQTKQEREWNSQVNRQYWATRDNPMKGKRRSPEFVQKMIAGVVAANERKVKRQLDRLGQYLTKNARNLIMGAIVASGGQDGNEDVMQSSDGSWLLAELQKSFDTSVKHIVRMAAIVRRLDELGVAIEMESSVLPYLRKIAHGNLSPDLFVTMQGHKSMLNIASTLPAPVQQQIAKNEPIKVMSTNGDFRMVPPLSMTTKEVSQVFAFGRIRDEAEQVGYLRGKMQEKATTDQACEEDAVKIDRKRRGIVVGKTFISFIELEHFYKALAPKKKSRQAV
jgi:hypothetical protein